MDQKLLEKYAELLVKVGVNLQDGQNLVIKGDSCHWPFVDIIQKVAYTNGAGIIRSELVPPSDLINRVKYQDEKYLDRTPNYLDAEINTYVDENWAYLRLDGSSDPDAYEGLDQERNAKIEKAYRQKAMPLFTAYMNGKCHWCIAPVPTKKWADKVLKNTTDKDLTEDLWETLIPILRLDKEDAIKAWEEHNNMLSKRIDILDSHNFDYLHFTGPNTDLKIYLSEKSKWAGGNFTSPEGIKFNPNLPTEEIFTTPDGRKTTGYIQVTKPVMVLGTYVEDAWFEFVDGEVVNYKASKNKESLDKYFEIDPGAKSLGEVALVDESSPITKTNLLFNSILLDENASCHIALGRGIPSAIEGGAEMSPEELKEIGCNMSLLHTDFMVGSENVSVKGYRVNGEEVSIIKDGYFTI